MPPPLHDEDGTPSGPKIHRGQEGENAVPTEYSVLLPPEYHPLRPESRRKRDDGVT